MILPVFVILENLKKTAYTCFVSGFLEISGIIKNLYKPEQAELAEVKTPKSQ